MTVVCPALVIEIVPAHMHMSLELLLRAGFLEIKTVGDPGVQGVAVAGTQGAGVGTPDAAAVAAITTGLVFELHMPKVKMFFKGI